MMTAGLCLAALVAAQLPAPPLRLTGVYPMMKTSLCLAALVAAPAVARTVPPPAPAVPDTSAGDRKYCIARDPATGDKLTRPRCRTLAEWQRQGVELPPAR